MNEVTELPEAGATGPRPRAIPGPLGLKVLLFEFLVLVEYWLAPLVMPIDNYVGLWSDVGVLLFAALMATLAVAVVLPLRLRLRPALRNPRLRWTFHGLWIGAVLVGLFATATFRIAASGSLAGAPALQVDWEPVATPFGAWPTLLFAYAPLNLLGALNVEVLTLLGVLSVIWASVVVLGMARPAERCEARAPAASRWSRAAALLMWGPLGFMTGCASCTPLYVALLGLAAPGAALSAYNSIPLVPWIGLAGLLYVASLAITLRLLHRVTGAAPIPPAPAPAAPTLREVPA